MLLHFLSALSTVKNYKCRQYIIKAFITIYKFSCYFYLDLLLVEFTSQLYDTIIYILIQQLQLLQMNNKTITKQPTKKKHTLNLRGLLKDPQISMRPMLSYSQSVKNQDIFLQKKRKRTIHEYIEQVLDRPYQSPLVKKMNNQIPQKKQSKQILFHQNKTKLAGYEKKPDRFSVRKKFKTTIDEDCPYVKKPILKDLRIMISKIRSKSRVRNQLKLQQYNQSITDYVQYTMKYSYRSVPGKQSQMKEKINQDTFIIVPMLNNKTYKHFFAVCDGYGKQGHLISKTIKLAFQEQLKKFRYKTKQFQDNYNIIINQYFAKVEKAAEPLNSKIKNSGSGSSCVSIWLINDKIYCANIGNCRAIIAKQKNSFTGNGNHNMNQQFQIKQISQQQNLISDLNERIWILDYPHIEVHTFNKKQKIIIIGSNGFWKCMTNEQCIEIVWKFYQSRDVNSACNELLQSSKSKWDEDKFVIQDITFLIFFIYFE